MTVRVIVTGDDQVVAAFTRAAFGADQQARQAALETAHAIEQDWERQAPVDRGVLASDRANVVEPVNTAGVAGAMVYNDRFYARFLQFGTVNMSPRYDFFGAAEPHISRFGDALVEAVTDL